MARNVAWGIDIGESAVKVVQLRKSGDVVTVQHYSTVPCEAHGEEGQGGDRESRVRNALDTLQEDVSLKKGVRVVSISGQDVFPRFIPLPPVEKKRVPEIVRYEARTQMPFPIEEVIWDYQPLDENPAPGDEIEVALFAIKRATVYSFLANLRLARLVPDIVEISPLALYNFLIYDQDIDTGTVVIDIGAGNTDLVIIDGERYWTRNVSISGNDITRALQEKYQISFEEAETLKQKASKSKQASKLFGVMRPILDDLLGEIQRSIGYYKAQTRNVVIERVVLLGNALKLRGLVEYFRRSLDYEVVVLDKLERIRVGDGSKAEEFFTQLPNYGAAIGLALQGLGLARVNIDMQPAAVVRARVMRKKIPFAAAAVGLLALPIFLGFQSVKKDVAYCESQIKEVDPQIQALKAKETQEKKEADLGAMPKDLEEMLPIGRGRSRWLHFFDSLNKALNRKPPDNIPREQYLLRFIGEEQAADRRAGSRRRRMMAPPEPGAEMSEQEDKSEQEPKELRVELQFQREGKSTTFSDEDVTKLKRLLKDAPHVLDVEIGLRPKMKRDVPDPRSGRSADSSDMEVEVQHLIVIFSMEPAGKE